MNDPCAFWDTLAPQHAIIEDNYLDLRSLHRILPEVQPPVLVVGAGHGLLVEELRDRGFECQGVDFSAEMIRCAKLRRALDLIQADAKAMPFGAGTFGTIIYATGVIDFIADEDRIRVILNEGRRVVSPAGKIFVAFYRLSPGLEEYLAMSGLLGNHLLSVRESLKMQMMSPLELIAWIARNAGVSYCRAVGSVLRMLILSSRKEVMMGFKMKKLFAEMDDPQSLIQAAPEKQPYRSETEVRNLFKRVAIPVNELSVSGGCFMVKIC